MTEELLAAQNYIMQKVPVLHVDEDWGQLDYYTNQFPVKFPCCLIDIPAVVWASKQNKAQQGDAELVLTVAAQKLTNTSGKAPLPQKQQAYAIHGYIKSLHDALHHYNLTSRCGRLVRSRWQRIKRDDGIQEFKVVYKFVVNDIAESNTGEVTGLTLQLEVDNGIGLDT
ncbi:hypothetical protein ACFOWM_06200 [Ferruginibacter yonginensis]|uniref:Uncharacterized protein n=1 Tax=Ferruginibacter yonginensis TaxID=1310416 RepID=A0ABV8QRI4_9BACT